MLAMTHAYAWIRGEACLRCSVMSTCQVRMQQLQEFCARSIETRNTCRSVAPAVHSRVMLFTCMHTFKLICYYVETTTCACHVIDPLGYDMHLSITENARI